MITPLFTALSRCATARAHLAGAEHRNPCPRYWRELATAATLSGHRWLEAERIGNEP